MASKVKKKYRMMLLSCTLISPLSSSIAGTMGDRNDTSWDGFYFGLNYAAATGSMSNDQTTSLRSTTSIVSAISGVTTSLSQTTTNTNVSNATGSTNGSYSNLFLGYNVDVKSAFILGGQLEGSFFSDLVGQTLGSAYALSTTQAIIPTPSTTLNSAVIPYQQTLQLTSLFTFLARGGKLITPNTLLYGLFGGVEGKFYFPTTNTTTGGASIAVLPPVNVWRIGWTAGGGIEYRITPHWSLMGEYRYMQFHFSQRQATTSLSVNRAAAITTSGPQNAMTSFAERFNLNAGLIGVAYRI